MAPDALLHEDRIADDGKFLANYSDGLTNLPLDSYVERARRTDAVACLVAVWSSNSLSGVRLDDNGRVTNIEYLHDSIRITGDCFVVRKTTLYPRG